jgi:hypothetical protein
VYRTLTLLCELVMALPLGTNLGLWHVLLALVSGRLLLTRGALIPALNDLGLAPAAVRRAWMAFAQGHWCIASLLSQWQQLIEREGRWQPRSHGGYRALAVDLTGFFRPRLKNCPTTHYDRRAGKALPAIPLALIAAVGQVERQRLAVVRAILRAEEGQSSEAALQQRALAQAVALAAADEALVVDRGFAVSRLQAAGAKRFVARGPQNFTARRARPPAYSGHGRPPTRGLLVRPLARKRKGHLLAATPADHTEVWSAGGQPFRADYWYELVLPNAAANAETFDVVVIHDPDYAEPLLLITPLRLAGAVLRELYLDRWSIEQLPLAAKQMIGAERQWVWAREARQRLPELAIWAGNILSYIAATAPAIASGYWDRTPKRTAGRVRRVLARADFFKDFTLPARMREKGSVTEQLPKGISARLRHYEKQRAAAA